MDAWTFQTEVRQMEKLMYRVSMSYLGNGEDAADGAFLRRSAAFWVLSRQRRIR